MSNMRTERSRRPRPPAGELRWVLAQRKLRDGVRLMLRAALLAPLPARPFLGPCAGVLSAFTKGSSMAESGLSRGTCSADSRGCLGDGPGFLRCFGCFGAGGCSPHVAAWGPVPAGEIKLQQMHAPLVLRLGDCKYMYAGWRSQSMRAELICFRCLVLPALFIHMRHLKHVKLASAD